MLIMIFDLKLINLYTVYVYKRIYLTFLTGMNQKRLSILISFDAFKLKFRFI